MESKVHGISCMNRAIAICNYASSLNRCTSVRIERGGINYVTH